MRIYIVRHGETEWNKLRRWQGSNDIPLSGTGIEQARKLAERLKCYKIEQIYSSPLSRALSTAQSIQQHINCGIILRDDLKEMTLGKWEGHTFEEIEEDYPELYYKWLSDPSFHIDGIENYQHLQDRAYNALTEIVKDGFNEILISTHGGWIMALMCKVLHIPLVHRMSFQVGNTSLNILDYDSSSEQFKMVTLNDVFHLEN